MNKSFTLIELLIVIAIIAILAIGIIILTIPGERLAQARDATRASHLSALETALYLYSIDEGTYPFGLSSTMTEICNTKLSPPNCAGLIDLSVFGTIIPIDPQGGIDPNGTGYFVALKDNRIYLSAPQAETKTISIGTLVDNWPDELGYIYNKGEHENSWVEGYNEGIVLTKGVNYLKFDLDDHWSKEAAWVTSESINLTGYNTLKVQFTVNPPVANLFRNQAFAAMAPPATASVALVVSTEQMSNKDVFDFRHTGDILWEDTLLSLSIESAESSYYIRIHAAPPYSDLYIAEVWLE